MNSVDAETDAGAIPPRRAKSRRRWALLLTIVLWLALIGGGAYGGHTYMNNLKEQWTAELNAQTAVQLEAVREQYESQINVLRQDLTVQIEQVDKQVNALNELLAFAKDTTDSDTDNSNQLYTQLHELKAQLERLEKNLDVLK
ncbi:hypothetical protein DUZ99_06940 [Xylanibacillus composti]|uniref:Uncharacterized protein n=1 Tax=Xylanibacillus composti TaxID=1572762 RepID=A0A8J4M3E2_9BACL|nr:hypothetical protein [Xylanibacillus composti]MDT9724728.1 hypothetical protein [Xylanibacillus composti]GIQ70729.1 hypothetical protein XYCOK13_35530 [Xylanibacillus composti]